MCIGAPVDGDAAPFAIYDQIVQATRGALAWQKDQLHIRRDSAQANKLAAAGVIGAGTDSVVLAVVAGFGKGAQSYALKVTINDARPSGVSAVAAQTDVQIHHAVQGMFASAYRPIATIHASWTVFTTPRTFFASFARARTYAGSEMERQDLVIMDALVRRDPDTDAPMLDTPCYIACAMTELLTATLRDLTTRYTSAQLTPLLANTCLHVVATLAALKPIGFTHNDMHPGNIYVTGSAIEGVINYTLESGQIAPVPLLQPRLPGLLLRTSRVVIADFGRAAIRRTGENLGMWLGWTDDQRLMGLVNWPNFANPGYDMWILACSLLGYYETGQLPAIFAHMVPTTAQINTLVARLSGHPRQAQYVEVLQAVRAAVNGSMVDRVRAVALMKSQDAQHTYYWRIPWRLDFFRDPVETLQLMGTLINATSVGDGEVVALK